LSDANGRGERAFAFLRRNERAPKPRRRGLTEIRGPYYSVIGRRYLRDLLEMVGHAVDIFKFSGGSFAAISKVSLRELIDVCHEHDVLVSTGGFVERVLLQGPGAVDDYLDECRELGFDIVEVSSGFLSIPMDDLARLTERVKQHGLEPKPEVNVQLGAGGSSPVQALEAQGGRDVSAAIAEARRHLELGAPLVMLESEGVTENVRAWRTDVVAAVVSALGLEKVMFEAADPAVFGWYVKTFGPEVNLFVDHSQIVQLECLREGLWGTSDVWGRVVTYKEAGPVAAREEDTSRRGTSDVH
jgi:phosphosulfolactate synthase (CoM biosynthesis protein A)